MAFTAATWGQGRLLTGLSPGSSLSNYESVITKDNLPVSALDTGLLSLINGGGDFRLSTDINGANQLPVEIVTCVTNATASSTKFIAWVRFPTYASGTREVYAFWNKAGQSQPAANAAFGSESVWQDYILVTHDGITDSTGNNTLNSTNTTTSAGKFSNSSVFNGSSSRIDATISPTFQGGTLQSWIKGSTTGATSAYISIAKSSVSNQQIRSQLNSSFNDSNVFDGSVSSVSTTTTLVNNPSIFQMCHNVYSPSLKAAYHGGGNQATDTTSYSITGIDRLTLGVTADSSPFGFYPGEICESWYTEDLKSADKISSEYDNQSDPSAFWTGGTVFVPGGTPLAITPNSINSASISLNPTIQYSAVVNLTPNVINSTSVSLDPVIQYKSILFLTPVTINSASISLNPSILLGPTQTIGNITAGFADDLYSVKYKISGITVNFKG